MTVAAGDEESDSVSIFSLFTCSRRAEEAVIRDLLARLIKASSAQKEAEQGFCFCCGSLFRRELVGLRYVATVRRRKKIAVLQVLFYAELGIMPVRGCKVPKTPDIVSPFHVPSRLRIKTSN